MGRRLRLQSRGLDGGNGGRRGGNRQRVLRCSCGAWPRQLDNREAGRREQAGRRETPGTRHSDWGKCAEGNERIGEGGKSGLLNCIGAPTPHARWLAATPRSPRKQPLASRLYHIAALPECSRSLIMAIPAYVDKNNAQERVRSVVRQPELRLGPRS